MKYYACPPSWNLTPAQYSTWRHNVEQISRELAAQHRAVVNGKGGMKVPVKVPTAPVGASVGGLLGMSGTWGGLAALVMTNPHPAQFLLVFPAAGAQAVLSYQLFKRQRGAKGAYELAALPGDHAGQVLPLSTKVAESMSFDIEHKHIKGSREDALEKIWAIAKQEQIAASQKAAADALQREADAKAKAVAKEVYSKDQRIAELEKALSSKIVLDNPLPAPVETPDNEDLLKLASARHEKIRDAWTKIITDPLNALDHASLFDVSDTRTAAFISAYGALEDLLAIHPSGIPYRLVESYSDQTRECERLWDDALAYSSKRGFDFLPAGERDIARKASRLLALAADENAPISERAAAATKAGEMLAKIHTVALPEPSRAQIEALSRLQLTA